MNSPFGQALKGVALWGVYGSIFGAVAGFFVLYVLYLRGGDHTYPSQSKEDDSAHESPILEANGNILVRIADTCLQVGDVKGVLDAVASMPDREDRDAALGHMIDRVTRHDNDSAPKIPIETLALYVQLARAIEDKTSKAQALEAVADFQAASGAPKEAIEPLLKEALENAKAGLAEEAAKNRSLASSTKPSVVVPPSTEPLKNRANPRKLQKDPDEKSGWPSAMWPVGLGVFGFIFAGLSKPAIDAVGKTFGRRVALYLQEKQPVTPSTGSKPPAASGPAPVGVPSPVVSTAPTPGETGK